MPARPRTGGSSRGQQARIPLRQRYRRDFWTFVKMIRYNYVYWKLDHIGESESIHIRFILLFVCFISTKSYCRNLLSDWEYRKTRTWWETSRVIQWRHVKRCARKEGHWQRLVWFTRCIQENRAQLQHSGRLIRITKPIVNICGCGVCLEWTYLSL